MFWAWLKQVGAMLRCELNPEQYDPSVITSESVWFLTREQHPDQALVDQGFQ